MALIVAFAAAFVIGFAAHRASICTVKAVAEIISTGRVHMLASFLKTAMWVLSLTILAMAVFGHTPGFSHWPVTYSSALGGLVFGIGAAMNGGCTFATITRLGDGDLNFLFTILGWPVGALIAKMAFAGLLPQALPTPSMTGLPAGPVLLALALAACGWIAWQSWVIFRPLARAGNVLRAPLAPQYRLSVAAALLAIGNLVLYSQFQSWSFTSVTLSTVLPDRFVPSTSIVLLWAVLLVTLAGVFVSARMRASFALQGLVFQRVLGHSLAGIAMGAGAALIPGGNDSLVLYGLASLSPHAAPAYLAILVGIALVFQVMRWAGMPPPPVYCSGDICMLPAGPEAAVPGRPRA